MKGKREKQWKQHKINSNHFINNNGGNFSKTTYQTGTFNKYEVSPITPQAEMFQQSTQNYEFQHFNITQPPTSSLMYQSGPNFLQKSMSYY